MARRSVIAALLLLLSAGAHGQGAFNLFQPPPSTGVMKGTPNTYVTTNAAASDVISLFNTGSTCTSPTTEFLRADGNCAVPAGSGSGSVTSVNYTAPTSLFSCTGGPITGSGTIACTFATGQTATELIGTDSSGNVSLFALTGAYVPPINLALTSNGGITNTLGVAHGGTAATSLTTHGLLVGEGTSAVNALAALAADTVVMGQGTSADPAGVSVPNCGSGTTALSYSTSTHSWGCQTISAGTGTVTSIGMTVPSVFSVSPASITTSGTFALSFAGSQAANMALMTPSGTTGALGLRSLVGADLPPINAAITTNGGLTGNLPVARFNGGTGASSSTCWFGDGTWKSCTASGTVTSVAQTVPSWLSVSGSPITGSGTLAITAASGQTANEFLATPNGITGALGLRSIVAADLPGSITSSTSGNAATATALAATPTQCSSGNYSTGIAANGNANCNPLSTGGTVTSITSGTGITLSPSTITTTGSVGLNLGAPLTWTGIPTYSGTSPAEVLNATGAGTNQTNTIIKLGTTGNFAIASATDGAPTTGVTNAIQFARSGDAWQSETFGNTTDNPSFTFAGTGATSFGGNISVTGSATVGGQNVCLANGSNCPGGIAGLANPTGTIGLTAVNGSATTAMRSDAAPALSPAISPTWTGTQMFNGGGINSVSTAGVNIGNSAGHAIFRAVDSNGGTNGKAWQMATTGSTGTQLAIQAVSDDWTTTYTNALTITRNAAAIANVSFGNPADNPTYFFNGSGATTFSGPVNANSSTGVSLTVNGSSGNTALVVNPSSSSTGVAVVAPASATASIALRGNNNAGSAAGIISQDASSNVHLANLGAASIDLDTNGSNRASIDQNGAMILNTPASGAVLTASAAAGSPAIFSGANASTGSALKVQGNFTGSGTTSLLQLTDANNTNGANLEITGNGTTTPNKFLRVAGGTFQVINSGYTSSLFSLADNGNLTLPSNGANQIAFLSAPASFTSELFVGANGNSSGSSMLVQQDTSHNGYLRNQDTGSLFLGTGSTNYWSITPSGEMTNGTAPSSGTALALNGLASDSTLTVDASPSAWATKGAIDLGPSGAVEADSGNLNLANNLYYSSGWKYKTANPGSYIQQLDSNGNIIFATAPMGTAGSAATVTTREIIYNDGGIVAGSPVGGDQGAGNINAQGLLINGSQPALYNGTSVTGPLQLNWTGGAGWESVLRWSNDANGNGIFIGKSRGTSVGTQTVVASGDQLGSVNFVGSDGTSLQTAAQISAYVDGTPGSGSMPGRIVLSTTPAGSSSAVPHMTIYNGGGVAMSAPGTANVLSLTTTGNTTNGALAFNFDSVGDSFIYNTVAGDDLYIGSNAASAGVVLATNNFQRLTVNANGNTFISPPTSGAALAVTGTSGAYTTTLGASTTSGSSFGLLVEGGTTSADAAVNVKNASGSTDLFEIFGDGGTVFGSATGGDKGPGTVNMQGCYVNGVACGGGSGTVTSITAGTGLTGGTITGSGTIALSAPVSASLGGSGEAGTITGIVYANSTSAFTAATTSQVASTLSGGSIPAPGSGTTGLTVNGVAGSQALLVKAPNTSGQSDGLTVEAGTNSTDLAVNVVNAANTSTLFKVAGDGTTYLPSGGLVLGGASGASQGAGTINMQGCFINGVACTSGVSHIAYAPISSGCVIGSPSSNVTGCSHTTGSGIYNVSISGFSSVPMCTASTGVAFVQYAQGTSSSTVAVFATYNTSGANTDEAFNLICVL